MLKVKKFFQFSFAIGTITSLVFVPIFSFNQNKNLINNEKLATINFASKKFVVNDWKIPTSKSTDGKKLSDKVSDTIELKLYLDVFNEKGNLDERIDSLLNKIKRGFKNKNINWKIQTSAMLPIVWFYFNDVEKSKEFIKYVDTLDFVKRIVFYKKVIIKNNDVVSQNEQNGHYISRFSDINKKLLLKEINLNPEKQTEFFKYHRKGSKIVILEVGTTQLQRNYKFVHTPEVKLFTPENLNDTHGTNVSMVAAGKNGINSNGQIYFTSFSSNNFNWQNALEWLVLKNNVKFINHSYGPTADYSLPYDDDSFFIDYISRKYGVVNVFAAGNGHNKQNKKGKWIDSTQLAYNAISVGSTKYRENSFLNDIEISNFSNRELESNHLNLPKPLVVAPGEILLENNDEIRGTSFAAPVVTGAISYIFDKFSWLNNDQFRVPSAMSILAASAHLPKYKNLNKKGNGFDSTYGAGLIDVEKMQEAAWNINTKSVIKSDVDGGIFESSHLNLQAGEQINIALSWMFNSGLLKENENKPELQHPNWWEWLFPTWALAKQTAQGIDYELKLSDWKSKHINENRLKLEETKKRQNQALFTDYDLVLEKLDSRGYWQSVSSSLSINSNVELIKFKVQDSGIYRYIVKKYKSSLFENSVDDSIAVTHTVFKEN